MTSFPSWQNSPEAAVTSPRVYWTTPERPRSGSKRGSHPRQPRRAGLLSGLRTGPWRWPPGVEMRRSVGPPTASRLIRRPPHSGMVSLPSSPSFAGAERSGGSRACGPRMRRFCCSSPPAAARRGPISASPPLPLRYGGVATPASRRWPRRADALHVTVLTLDQLSRARGRGVRHGVRAPDRPGALGHVADRNRLWVGQAATPNRMG